MREGKQEGNQEGSEIGDNSQEEAEATIKPQVRNEHGRLTDPWEGEDPPQGGVHSSKWDVWRCRRRKTLKRPARLDAVLRLLFKIYRNIGEAANPGPGEVVKNIKIWSANVTSLAKRWEVMCKWEVNIIAAQEVRLGEEAQRIMAARITQDLRVPIMGRPMPLKEGRVSEGGARSRPTIWDAQQ